MKWRPRLKILFPCLFVLGLLSLSYVFGAAAVFFDLPSSQFLEKAFTGGKAWFERKDAVPRTGDDPLPPAIVDEADKPGKTFDGFTLYTTHLGSRASLIDMRGNVVHQWTTAFSQIWPRPVQVKDPVDDSLIYIFGCHLYANGDLLAVLQAYGDTPYGYGLVKLDKDSRVLWSYPENVHHDVDVAEDGTIYALTQRIVGRDQLPKGLDQVPTPCLVDYLVVLDPETGQERNRIGILDAFLNSPFAIHLNSIGKTARAATPPGMPLPAHPVDLKADILHTNFVQVLTQKLAPRFPQFKAGQVLISVRQLDTIAVLDPGSGAIVWAVRGPWRGQHDPQFLDNGRLLIFDNLGSPRGSRVLEYDPRTQAFPWSYTSENTSPFVTVERGMSQRLPNGNTLIVNSDGGKLLEVTPAKELVWSCACNVHVPFARRYAPAEVAFLKGGQRARP